MWYVFGVWRCMAWRSPSMKLLSSHMWGNILMPNCSDVHNNVQNLPRGSRRYRYINIDKVFDANVSSGDKTASSSSSSSTTDDGRPTTLTKAFYIITILSFSLCGMCDEWYYLMNRLSCHTFRPSTCQITCSRVGWGNFDSFYNSCIHFK